MSIDTLIYVMMAAYVALGAASFVANKELDEREAKLKRELFYQGAGK